MPIQKGMFAVIGLYNANFITGRFCQDIENGVIQINAKDFPCFLYPKDSYNPDNVEEGLLHGEFLCLVLNVSNEERTRVHECNLLLKMRVGAHNLKMKVIVSAQQAIASPH